MSRISRSIVVGIDASRNRSGGARAHLIGVLTAGDFLAHGIKEVHVWAYRDLLDTLPDTPWLIKHSPLQLERSLLHQLWWQATRLAQEAKAVGCDILFATDASTLCRFKPMIVLSQDILSFEPRALKLYRFSKQIFRLLAILWVQNRAFRFADGVIFLTRHASKVIQRSCGSIARYACIPHGVGDQFRQSHRSPDWPNSNEQPIRLLYVSNAELYKHQWMVIKAVDLLRNRGHNVEITLLGGGCGFAQNLIDRERALSDPKGLFVRQLGFLDHKELPAYMEAANIFIFASSCEAFGITLLEGMAAGLPIACSDRSCLPELAEDGAVYFDPEDTLSIANSIELVIKDEALRTVIAQRAKALSNRYSWGRCAKETWSFVVDTYEHVVAQNSGKASERASGNYA